MNGRKADQGCRKPPKSSAGLERNQVPLSAEITAFNRNPVPVCSDFCNLVLSESLLRTVVQLGCSRVQNLLVDEPDVLCDGVAPNVQFVGWEIRVGIAYGQTAYDRQLGWDIQLSSNNVRITCY